LRFYLQALWRTALAGLGGLLVGCLVVGCVLGLFIGGSPGAGGASSVVGGGLSTALVAMAFGVVPVFLLGVPLYALAWVRGHASQPLAVGLALVAALLCLLGGSDSLAALVLVFGVPVALVTHALADRMELP
jgi:hypothetical protein